MSCKYIAIEREYGSGGTKIARQLAEETGISCYGPEILQAASRTLGVPVERIQQYEETVANSFLYTTFILSRVQEGSADMLTREGHIFLAEQREIRNLAASGPAVFIGHCASEALKDRKVARVYIRCSDDGVKRRRIAEDYGVPPASVDSVRKRFDNKRARYYFANTAKKWDDLRNYDMVMDSARLGVDGCVQALKSLL